MPSKKVLGKSSGKTKIKGARGAIGSATLDPSKSGDPAVVADRENQAMQGTMLSKQLRSSKSAGMKPRR